MTFLKSVLQDLNTKYTWENLTFILPSKRAGTFLKKQLAEMTTNTTFSPEITSIETFVESLSGIKQISNVELLFYLYEVYKTCTPDNQNLDSFDTFCKWGNILLQDFNEIDRYLIQEEKLFDYLKAINKINHWSVNTETEITKNYLNFWSYLPQYYKAFTQTLLSKNCGYQGLVYKKAQESISGFLEDHQTKRFIFAGFNALNTAEALIIKKMLNHNVAHVYWNIDTHFLEDASHSVGYFIRKYKNEWPHYKNHPFKWSHNTYQEKKNINIIGIPKRVGQAKQVGNILKNISKSEQAQTALILGNENLLLPILNSLPETITNVNITMGVPLKLAPIATLFQYLFECHKNSEAKFHYKTVLKIINHPTLKKLFIVEKVNYAEAITNYINDYNLIYLSVTDIIMMAPTGQKIIELLFQNWTSVAQIIDNCAYLITLLKENLNTTSNKDLELEYLFRFYELFNKIKLLNSKYNTINNLKALKSIYEDLLSNETLDFKGEPLQGLQIMGMLESRVLDFKTVIITDVNEGVLPAGKTQNSFIPYDVKIENGLPTYKEKDAVYTNHFYSLIQRAETVYILYNTEIDSLKGGEKSRFITQLETENIHNITHTIATPPLTNTQKIPIQINKTKEVLSKIQQAAIKGFSPSSLLNYIKNPINFYYEKILGIPVFQEAEENIAANTFGSIIHNTLEDFYKPLENQFLEIQYLQKLKPLINETVAKHFKKLYLHGNIKSGKNLIAFEVAKQYIINFLNQEIKLLKQGHQIKIISIENNESTDLAIDTLSFPVKLKGKIDRIDQLNGITRIIDYKSGVVTSGNLSVSDWDTIITDYIKYGKSFQILFYVYLMLKNNKITLPVEAGMISFKKLSDGFIKFTHIEGKTKNNFITEVQILAFETQLKQLISEILNPNACFKEKIE